MNGRRSGRKLGAAARPIIPKRGEKDFEPAPGGGSGLQLHVLDRSRDAMFEALRANRTISRLVEFPPVEVAERKGVRTDTLSQQNHKLWYLVPFN